MSPFRARTAITGLAVAAIALATAAGSSAWAAPATTNPKDLAVAKAAVLQQTDVPAGFNAVPTKVTKLKPTGIKACKATEAMDKVTTGRAKSEFDSTGASIQDEVDTFKTPAALNAALSAFAAPASVTCFKAQTNAQLAKDPSTKQLKRSIAIVPQPVTQGSHSVGYLVTVTLSKGTVSQDVVIFVAVVGVGRAGSQVTYTDTTGTPDPAVIQQLLQAAATRLAAAQQ
jgi:hypothetical protein